MTKIELQPYLTALSGLIQPVRAADFPRPLEPMRRLLVALDHPERAFESIVVAGSVGKGTACVQIAHALRGSGPVGLYTGPHLHSFRERFVVDDEPISIAAFIAAAGAVNRAVAGLGVTYSTFEQATALALWWFRERGVRRAVLEVGIGGLYDAVNAVPNQLAVILPVELEHPALLGGTLTSIAAHKAGIIQPEGRAVSVPQVPEVESVIRAEAEAKGAALRFVPADALVETVGMPFMASAPQSVIASAPQPATVLPGRLEVIERAGRRIVVDGAHTPGSAGRLRAFIDQVAGAESPVHIIAGMLRDKSPREVFAPFDESRFRITVTTAPGHRAIPAAELGAVSGLARARMSVMPEVGEALASIESAPEAVQVVMGSLRMVAVAREALGLLSPLEMAEAQATRALFEGEGYLRRLLNQSP
jgi:dihydrofolate synthase/folylpolyglutamate synthase